MGKIFGSPFAYRMDQLGFDGYGVDEDEVWKALAVYKAQKGMRIEWKLPEWKEVCDRYRNDILKIEYIRRESCYRHGPGKIVPKSSLLFGILYEAKSNGSRSFRWMEFCNAWIEAHAAETINRIYGMHLQTMDNVLLLYDGVLDDIIETLFRGNDNPLAEQYFPIEKLAKERELGRELNEFEMARIRASYYRLSDDECDQLKNKIVDEIYQEWNGFVSNGKLIDGA